jgi:hypothetical protein
MTKWASVAAIGVLALAGGVSAQTPPEGMAWYVLNALNSFGFDIEDPTHRPALVTEVPDGVLVPLQINDDGRADWLIAWPESSRFCGTGGCRRTLYVSDGDAFVRAFDRQALDLRTDRVAGEVRIEARVHHLECADDRMDCHYAWTWDPAVGRLSERPSRDGVSRIAGTPTIDRGEEADGTPRLAGWTPPALSDALAAGRRICLSDAAEAGYTVVRPELLDLPDLNGDGLRDYMLVPAGDCEDLSAQGFQIWVTTGPGPGPAGQGGPVTLAWQAPLERWLESDVSTRPAIALVTSPCETGRICPAIALRWDAATGRLVE